MSDESPAAGQPRPASILKRSSSQVPQHDAEGGQQPIRRSATFATLPRQLSRHERLNEILEAGRERAIAMANPSPPAARTGQMLPDESEGGPTETTSFIRGITTSYQSTNNTTVNDANPRRTQAQPTNDADDPIRATEERHWWQDHLAGIWSVELENKGSVARDHLALERTFLAWLRTSLSFASIGIAVTQLFRLNTSLAGGSDDGSFAAIRHMGKPLGVTFLGISIVVLFLGYQRYIQSQMWIMKGKFPASRGTVILVTLIAFALMVASLVVVIIAQPASGRHQEL